MTILLYREFMTILYTAVGLYMTILLGAYDDSVFCYAALYDDPATPPYRPYNDDPDMLYRSI